MKILKQGDIYEPFGDCRVVRLLSSTETKTTYEVEWEGSQAVLKLGVEPFLVPESHPIWTRILASKDLPEGYAVLQEQLTGSSSLATVLAYGRPSLSERSRWVLELCHFLEAACPQGVVLETSNVLIDERQQLRVVSLQHPQDGESVYVSFGRLIASTLPDSATAVWLAARCKEQRVSSYTEIGRQLAEFLADEAPSTSQFDLPEAFQPKPRPWTAMLTVVSLLVLLGLFWGRPVRRTEPAVYLSSGQTIRLISESSARTLGSLRTTDSVTALTSSETKNRLYVAYAESPFIEILDGTDHRSVGRILTQPGASKLFLEADTIGAFYPQLRLFVILKTGDSSAYPVSLPEGPVDIALGTKEAAVCSGRQLEVYRLEPFSLLLSIQLEADCSALWSEKGYLRLAQGSEHYEFDSSEGVLKRLPEGSLEPTFGIETPHGYWTLEAERLRKLKERDGLVLASWPAVSSSAFTYLESSHAP